MSRLDIANYLGLTVETVSRVFSRMQKMSIIKVDNKEIDILELEGMRIMANIAN
jgi:CRP/FNR family transcriptional regulator